MSLFFYFAQKELLTKWIKILELFAGLYRYLVTNFVVKRLRGDFYGNSHSLVIFVAMQNDFAEFKRQK